MIIGSMGGSSYYVNPEADYIEILFASATGWGIYPMGPRITDINDSTGYDLIGVTIDTNWNDWEPSLLIYGDDFIEFNFSGTGSSSTDYIKAYLEFGPTPVPEPATLLLLSSGILGLAGFKRMYHRIGLSKG